jgi:hypothetical protein
MCSAGTSLGLVRPSLMPALLTRTSSSRIVSAAAAIDASSVTSSWTNLAPTASAACWPRVASRADPHLMFGGNELSGDLKAKSPVRPGDERRRHV